MMSSLTHQAKCYPSLRPHLLVTEAFLKLFPKTKTLIEKIKIPHCYILYMFVDNPALEVCNKCWLKWMLIPLNWASVPCIIL